MEFLNMKKEHKEILELLTEYLRVHPDQRFGQAIFNLGINEFLDRNHPEKNDFKLRDIYNDDDAIILGRMKRQLDWFSKQQK
jgi:hypothetical protein